MAGAQALAVIPMEILIKKSEVLPSRVAGEAGIAPVAGTVSLVVRQEQAV